MAKSLSPVSSIAAAMMLHAAWMTSAGEYRSRSITSINSPHNCSTFAVKSAHSLLSRLRIDGPPFIHVPSRQQTRKPRLCSDRNETNESHTLHLMFAGYDQKMRKRSRND